MARVLIAGESWVDYCLHIKGFDSFTSSTYGEGVSWLRTALERGGHTVDFIPNHLARASFPDNKEALAKYDVVILSDIGSNTLLLHPTTFPGSKPSTNRLSLVRDFTSAGGGLMMIGGYMSFQGIEGKARYQGTPIEEALPVELLPSDDRAERPEGVTPEVIAPDHPILAGVEPGWPVLLGYNRVTIKPGAELVAKVGDDPLIAAWSFGEGRSMVFTSDCSPHWGPPPFLAWAGYDPFWASAASWLSAGRA